MLRVRVGVQQADRNRFNTLAANLVDNRFEVFVIERLNDGPVPGEPATDFVNVAPRNELLRLRIAQLIERVPVAARNRVAVARSRRRDQEHALAATLEEGIEAHGCAVHEELDAGQVRDEVLDAVDDAAGRILRRRRHLADVHRSVGWLHDDVRKRTADVS